MIGPALATGRVEDPSDVHGPLDIKEFGLSQGVHGLTLSFSVAGPLRGRRLAVRPGRFQRLPGSLCAAVRLRGSKHTKRLCAGRRPGGPWQLGIQVLGSAGRELRHRKITPRVVKATRTHLRLRFGTGVSGLGIGRYRMHATGVWSGHPCVKETCRDRAPDSGSLRLRVYPLRLAGCRFGGIGEVHTGPTTPRRMALTFDDGPSAYTSHVVSILASHHAHGTFFEIGQEVQHKEAVMRSVIAHGDEIGDHSMHHSQYPSRSDIAQTARLIKGATGFRPCLFRPPYGATNSAETAVAKSLHMSSILWDVDPADWSEPGSGAIYQRVVSHAHPGGIVVMHDGGGNRSQTVAALPSIIDNLRSRGYKLVTVSRLLGQKPVYKLDR